jgi:hypothetical protein
LTFWKFQNKDIIRNISHGMSSKEKRLRVTWQVNKL